MGQVRHGSATTTHAVRAAIQRSQASRATLSRELGINPKTVAKWRKRAAVEDLKTGPKAPPSTTLTEVEEAMVVAFRRGKKVVEILGVFATPIHRPVAIASHEGNVARMRQGISALDYLITEVGFDPTVPGMINYKTTDLLLHKQWIDLSLHVVIWQVGLVGHFGFRRTGFFNEDFRVLVDDLEKTYDGECPLTLYIASRFVGVEPLIESIPIGHINDPDILSEISALSTFYIPLSLAVTTDNDMAKELQLDGPTDVVAAPMRAPSMSRYGTAEIEAIQSLSLFEPLSNYVIPEHDPEAEFLLALSEDLTLQNKYRLDPQAALTHERYPGLTEHGCKLLAIQHPLAIERSRREAQ